MNQIEKLSAAKVLCIGDVMLDRFISGSVKRISPESPVPVLSVQRTATVPGGAANVARNIASLGGQCTLLSVVGEDEVAEELTNAIDAVQGLKANLLRQAGRPPSETIRFVAHGPPLRRPDSGARAPAAAARPPGAG